MDLEMFAEMRHAREEARKLGRKGFAAMISDRFVRESDPVRRAEVLKYLALTKEPISEVLWALNQACGFYYSEEVFAIYATNIRERLEGFSIWLTYSTVLFGVMFAVAGKGTLIAILGWASVSIFKLSGMK